MHAGLLEQLQRFVAQPVATNKPHHAHLWVRACDCCAAVVTTCVTCVRTNPPFALHYSCGVSMLSHSMFAVSYAGALWSIVTLRMAPSSVSAMLAAVTGWSRVL